MQLRAERICGVHFWLWVCFTIKQVLSHPSSAVFHGSLHWASCFRLTTMVTDISPKRSFGHLPAFRDILSYWNRNLTPSHSTFHLPGRRVCFWPLLRTQVKFVFKPVILSRIVQTWLLVVIHLPSKLLWFQEQPTPAARTYDYSGSIWPEDLIVGQETPTWIRERMVSWEQGTALDIRASGVPTWNGLPSCCAKLQKIVLWAVSSSEIKLS